MNEDRERLLELVDPPAGGWERLRTRRDEEELQRAPWLAFAAGLGVAALAFVIADPFPRVSLTLPESSARLQGVAIADEPLRLLSAGRAMALPAAEGVQLYWTEPSEH
jgi:hypothetical protein